jgi:hypothetical protein
MSATGAAIRVLVASSACLSAYSLFVLARKVRDLPGGSLGVGGAPPRPSGDASYVHFRESIPCSTSRMMSGLKALWTADPSLGGLASDGSVSAVETTCGDQPPSAFATDQRPEDLSERERIVRDRGGSGSVVALVPRDGGGGGGGGPPGLLFLAAGESGDVLAAY